MSLFTGGLAVAAIVGASGASAASGIYGAKKMSSSADKSAAIQSVSADKALAYTKAKDAQEHADMLAAQKANYEQWAARERRMAPYRGAGQGASETIAGLLGLPAVDIPEPAPPPAFLTPPPAAATSAAPAAAGGPTSSVNGSANVGTMAALTGSGTVKMIAPNGMMKDVPVGQVEHYKKQGAQVVN